MRHDRDDGGKQEIPGCRMALEHDFACLSLGVLADTNLQDHADRPITARGSGNCALLPAASAWECDTGPIAALEHGLWCR